MKEVGEQEVETNLAPPNYICLPIGAHNVIQIHNTLTPRLYFVIYVCILVKNKLKPIGKKCIDEDLGGA